MMCASNTASNNSSSNMKRDAKAITAARTESMTCNTTTALVSTERKRQKTANSKTHDAQRNAMEAVLLFVPLHLMTWTPVDDGASLSSIKDESSSTSDDEEEEEEEEKEEDTEKELKPPPVAQVIVRSSSSTSSTVNTVFNTGIRVKGLTGRLPIPLYLTWDDDVLSPRQCWLRKHIVFFEATECHVLAKAQGRNRPILLGQVGIGCRDCHARATTNGGGGGGERSRIMFPKTLAGIYQAAQQIAKYHFDGETCPALSSYSEPQCFQSACETRPRTMSSGSGGGKEFWAANAQALGVYQDGGDGLRFFGVGSHL